MTKEEFAKMLGTTRQNLNKWEKERPELVRLINQGLALDEIIKDTKEHLERLESIKNDINIKKFKIK